MGRGQIIKEKYTPMALLASSQEYEHTHPSPTYSLSPNDIHSKAKCILHSVGLAL